VVWMDKDKQHELEKPEDQRDNNKIYYDYGTRDQREKFDHVLFVEKQRNAAYEGGLGLYFNPRNLRFEETSMGMGR